MTVAGTKATFLAWLCLRHEGTPAAETCNDAKPCDATYAQPMALRLLVSRWCRQALDKDNMGTMCLTLANLPEGAAPTFSAGESLDFKFG